MFSLLESLTNFVDVTWDTFVRNRFPNHTVELTHFGEHHLHSFVQLLRKRQDALSGDHPAHERFEEFWRGFDGFYRSMRRDFSKFMQHRTFELSYYNSLQTTGIYMVTVRNARTRKIIYRGVINRLCSNTSYREKQNLDKQTTII